MQPSRSTLPGDTAARRALLCHEYENMNAIEISHVLLDRAREEMQRSADGGAPTVLMLADVIDASLATRKYRRIPRNWSLEELQSNPETNVILQLVENGVREWLEHTYPQVSYNEMQQIVHGLNQDRCDPINWTLFHPQLGGLVNLKLHEPTEDAHHTWTMSHQVPGQPPHALVRCNISSLWISPAPLGAQLAYMDKNTIPAGRIDLNAVFRHELPESSNFPRFCNACGGISPELKCGCKLAHYCNAACKQTDFLHRPLCTYVRSINALQVAK